MRPNPVHQRTSRPECAPGRAPRLRQSGACGCTGAESGAARPCPSITQTAWIHGIRPQKKPAAAGPPPGGSKLTSRPAPLRGAPAAAGAMPPATCRGLPGLPAASPRGGKQTGRCQDIRGDALVRASAELCRWLCIRSPESARQGRRVRPHMYKAPVILVSPGCTCTHNPAGSELPGGLAGGARQAAR